MTRRTHRQLRRARGTILIVAMVVVFALASMALVLGRSMRVEAGISANEFSAAQAEAVARGAEQYVLAILAEGPDTIDNADESAFREVPVGRGRFWIVRPDYGDADLPAYGLVDESSKLDLNFATAEVLARVAGLDDAIAGAIVDWRDPDEEITGNGAESQAYAGLADAYRAKNSEFETVEELLLVKGMTRELLYGKRPAPPLGESSEGLLGGGIGSGRSLTSERYQERGVFDLFTVWSAQPEVTESTDATTAGARLDINNQQQRQQLRELINEVFGEARGQEIGSRITARPFDDVFDFAVVTQLTQAEFEQIETRIMAGDAAANRRGRVNVNQAPRDVLVALEGLGTSDADALLARRPTAVASKPGSIAWVYDVLKERSVGLGGQITGRGGQYSADIVAVSGDGRAFRRVRIVVDASADTASTPPRIVYRRDLTELGWPLDPSILEMLRSGGSIREGSALPQRREGMGRT